MQETTILENVFLFMPDRSIRPGAIAFNYSGIVAVGEPEAVRARAGGKNQTVSLPGALAAPGFVDSHTHMLGAALQMTRIDLRAVGNATQFSEAIRSWNLDHPSLSWIQGQYADTFLGGQLPARDWVDQVCGGKPLFLTRFDMHSALANTKALEIAGVNSRTPDPAGGAIVRDARSGEPTGLLLEKAMDLVADRIPPLPDEERVKALQKAFLQAHRLGLTQVHEVLFRWNDIDIFREALLSGPALRVFVRVPYKELDRLIGGREGEIPGRLNLDGVKGFVDGTLGSTTAWLKEPYAHAPSSRGMSCMVEEGEFVAEMKRAAGAGFSVSLHAIGDAGIRFALDLFDDVIRERKGEGPLRIEHFQHPGWEEIKRTGHPRFFASVQPAHLLDDAGPAEEKLGGQRAALSYPLKSLLDQGCQVIFGSDWDVADLNPLIGLQAAVTRVDKAGRFPKGWHPEQRIGIAQALECYTAAPVRATRISQNSGMLAEGKEADLTVLDRDITSVPAEEIARARVIMTVVGGRIVYRAD